MPDRFDEDGRPLPKIITYRAKWDPYSRDYHAVEGRCPPTDLDEAATAHIQDGPPGSWVYGYVYSSPQKLGWAQLDADGDATWTLPTLDPGVHQVAVLDSTGFLLGSRSFAVASASA